MRRTLLMIMAVALLLTQCRKPAVKFPSPVAPEGTTVSMTVTAGPGGKTDISETGAITWSTDDMIYVGHGGTYVGYLTLQSGAGSATGTFTGDVTLPNSTTGEQTFHFFYLGSGSQTLTAGESTQATVSFASQNIYNNDGKLENASKHHVGYGSAKGAVSDGGVTGINVMMKSKVALARFSFTDGTSPYPGELTLSGTHIYNSMTVNFGGTCTHGTNGNIILAAGHAERYVMLVPPTGVSAEDVTFKSGNIEGGATFNNGIEANKFYGRDGAIPVNVEAVPSAFNGTANPFEDGNW